MTAAGATNVVWVWSPITVISRPDVPLAPLYPGDDVVDWVGLSVYFSSPTARYTAEVPSTIAEIDRFAPTKPNYVAETSVLPGPNRPAMIRELVTGLLTIPNLIGLTWFNHDTNHDYRIDNDPEAAAELAAQLASPWFGGARDMGEPVVAPPLALTKPAITGVAEVGESLDGHRSRVAIRRRLGESDRRRAVVPVRRRRLAHDVRRDVDDRGHVRAGYGRPRSLRAVRGDGDERRRLDGGVVGADRRGAYRRRIPRLGPGSRGS